MGCPLFMVFDCESVGLHGETFAVGWTVVEHGGRELASGAAACEPALCQGTRAGLAWVEANVRVRLTHDGPFQLRETFWRDWLRWKAEGVALAADVPWPVEARFLARCVDDARRQTRGGFVEEQGRRDWEGPYPLIDVASVRLAAGFDPLADVERLPGELPAHDPLADARQSARLLLEALAKIEAGAGAVAPAPEG